MKYKSRKKLKQEIEELKDKNRTLDREYRELFRRHEGLSESVETLKTAENSLSPDCKLGGYCSACIHRKLVYMPKGLTDSEIVTVCGRGGPCKNFIQDDRFVKEKK